MAKEKYEIWFDGKSNRDFGIKLQGDLKISEIVPNEETVTVLGRNGTLVYSDGTYQNRIATISGYVYKDDFVKENLGEITTWLFGNSRGYKKLMTSDDLDHYFLARVKNAAEVADRIRRLLPFNIEFDCKPQRFLVSGDEMIFSRGGIVINNQTAFASHPLLHFIVGEIFSSSFKINDAYFSFDNMTGNFYFDTETFAVYADDGSKSSGRVLTHYNDDVGFASGWNRIEAPDSFAIEIYPRWWEL